MKTLILSSNNGAGHNSAARAVMERLSRRGVPCEMHDAISFRSPTVSEAIREIHINSALHAKWLFKVGNKAASYRIKPNQRSACYLLNTQISASICAYARDNGFDTILCTHIFPALAVTYARRRQELGARAYFLATDYDCTPHVDETRLDGYFLPHPQLVGEYVEKGLPLNRLYATGIPVSERFLARAARGEARARLSLPADGPIMLIMCGSMGFGRVRSLVARLLREGPADMSAVVLTGNNRELYRELIGKYGPNGRVRAVRYTDQVSLYMDACDVLFTKPGGLSVTEAAAKRIPLVLTDPIPGWETDNAMFFERLGMCRTGAKTSDYVGDALALMNSRALREEMILAQRENIDPGAAERICDILMARA